MVNKKQEIAISTCIIALDSWLTTNDIKSPSHYTLIDEDIFDLKEKIENENNCDLIGDTLKDLLGIIKSIK